MNIDELSNLSLKSFLNLDIQSLSKEEKLAINPTILRQLKEKISLIDFTHFQSFIASLDDVLNEELKKDGGEILNSKWKDKSKHLIQALVDKAYFNTFNLDNNSCYIIKSLYENYNRSLNEFYYIIEFTNGEEYTFVEHFSVL